VAGNCLGSDTQAAAWKRARARHRRAVADGEAAAWQLLAAATVLN